MASYAWQLTTNFIYLPESNNLMTANTQTQMSLIKSVWSRLLCQILSKTLKKSSQTALASLSLAIAPLNLFVITVKISLVYREDLNQY